MALPCVLQCGEGGHHPRVRGVMSGKGRHNHSSQFQLWHTVALKYVKLLSGKSSGGFTLLLLTFYRTKSKVSHLIFILLNSTELHSTLPLSIIYAKSVPVKLSIIYLSSCTGHILSVNVKGKYPKNVPCFALGRVLYLCWP